MNRSRYPQRGASDAPGPEVVLRLAELIARLPLASARSLARVRAVARPPEGDDPGEALRGTWGWRELDWLPLYAHLGRTRGWLAARVRAIPAAELLVLLERDLGRGGQRDPSPLVGAEGRHERPKDSRLATSSTEKPLPRSVTSASRATEPRRFILNGQRTRGRVGEADDERRSDLDKTTTKNPLN